MGELIKFYLKNIETLLKKWKFKGFCVKFKRIDRKQKYELGRFVLCINVLWLS